MVEIFINQLNISEEAKQELMNYWSLHKEIKRGDFLIHNNKIDRNLYLIEKGTFKIFYPLEDQEAIVGFGYPPNILCDFISLSKNVPSPFYIQALKTASLKGILYEDFMRIVNTFPSMKDAWQTLIEQALLGRIDREIDLLMPNPKQRYLRLLNRSPQVFQHIPLKYIAAYLRMTPETLSRLRR